MNPMAAPMFRSWAEISRQQIAENYRAVRNAVGPNIEPVCVVKADAYGHGAIEVSRTLAAEGATWLGVTSAEEGVALRQAGLETRILVMADCLPFARPAVLEYGLTPVIDSLESLREMENFVASRGATVRYHLKIDSGMGRLGTRAGAAEIAAAVRGAPHLELEGLMSHLASSADYTKTQTGLQMDAFEKLCDALRAEGIVPRFRHLSSTNPIAYGRRKAWYNMVRPGHALYGYLSPARGQAPTRVLNVKPALTWRAAVLSVKEVPEGTLIGYGGIFCAPKPLRIGILAVGYADGLTTIDLSDCPAIGVGSAVTLLGSEGEASINAQQMARTAGTISYDILCGIHPRVKRVYV
jgi:alanine racemase